MFECLCERKNDLVTREPTGSDAWNSIWSCSERCSRIGIDTIVCPFSSVFSQEPNQYKGWNILQEQIKKRMMSEIEETGSFVYSQVSKHDIGTCNSIEALAQRTPLPKLGRNELPYWEPANLAEEELIMIVISSPPSLLIGDHPSSTKPFTASLKPRQSLWLKVLKTAGWRPPLYWTSPLVS
jgi:hypothetical protein